MFLGLGFGIIVCRLGFMVLGLGFGTIVCRFRVHVFRVNVWNHCF